MTDEEGKATFAWKYKSVLWFILLGLLLFGTAGTYYYWNGIFLLTLAILMISMGGFLYKKTPLCWKNDSMERSRKFSKKIWDS